MEHPGQHITNKLVNTETRNVRQIQILNRILSYLSLRGVPSRRPSKIPNKESATTSPTTINQFQNNHELSELSNLRQENEAPGARASETFAKAKKSVLEFSFNRASPASEMYRANFEK